MQGDFGTPRECAEEISTSPDRIVDLINAGELLAIDIRGPGSKRATWRISRDAWEDFLRRRQSQAPKPKQKRQKTSAYVPTFY